MGRESRRTKRKRGHRSEDSDDERRLSYDRSQSRSPEKKSRKLDEKREKSITVEKDGEESLSIEETNKLRASLGLAPLDLQSQTKVKISENDGEKVYVEHGIEIVHRAPEHIGDKKRSEELRLKLDTMKEKRRLHSKVLGKRGIIDSYGDDVEDAASWVAKSRDREKEKKQAEERARMLDEMDAEFGIDSFLDQEKERRAKARKQIRNKQRSDIGNLIIGHDKESFLQNNETILVLEDRDILGDGEEVLVNPNLVENERHVKNVDRLKKKSRYEPYAEDVDEFGMAKPKGLLAKYDEELEGEERKTFRLDEKGEYNLEQDQYELEVKKRLSMLNRKLESLENPKYKVASEYYSQEEMKLFRKSNKKKDSKKLRKRKEKVLKADDLIPDDGAMKDDIERAKLAATRYHGRGVDGSPNREVKSVTNVKLEEGELVEEDDEKREEKWHAAEVSGIVDMQRINQLVEEDKDSDSDDDLIGGIGLVNIAIEDEAESELRAILDKTRRLRTLEKKETVEPATKVYNLLKEQIKDNPEVQLSSSGIIIDSTMEYCHTLGDVHHASGQKDNLLNQRSQEQSRLNYASRKADEIKDDNEDEQILEEARRIREQRTKDHRHAKGRWFETTATSSVATNDEFSKKAQSKNRSEGVREAYSLLGEERDVSKGVGAALKLAASKGYLDNYKEMKVNGPSLKHLQSQNCCQIESSRYDMDEKYTKKLERMGTTGTGPIRSFPEKTDYKPDIRIDYVDEKGREMDPKDAFRNLSWKFHGKGPGKKQVEKRLAKTAKKELMRKMNSLDTPLGTLNKQLKKQETMQTPYIILSGTGRDTGAPLKKD